MPIWKKGIPISPNSPSSRNMMNERLWLKAGKALFTLEEIKLKSPPEIMGPGLEVVEFCHQWLNGRTTFEFSTSGSTGPPKKISFFREQLTASAKLTEVSLKLLPGYTALICLDIHFIAGAMMLVRSLVTGMNMIIVPPSSDPLKGITDAIDFAAFVPFQLPAMIQQEPEQLNAIKKIIIGGAPLDESLVGRLQGHPGNVYSTYGMTETLTHVALRKVNGPDRQKYFQLLPGIRASLDERGCLIIHADHLGDPLITNDRVTLLGLDRFQWEGRIDRLINSGGIKVQAEKIEKIVEEIFADLKLSNRFFISGIPDPQLSEKVVLIVEGHISHSLEEQISGMLKKRLSRFELPRRFFLVDRFMETESQKIDRQSTLKQLLK